MRISSIHLCRLEVMLNDTLARLGAGARAAILAPEYPPARLRWDLLWAVPAEVRGPWLAEVYAYADDRHIDTALRHALGMRAE